MPDAPEVSPAALLRGVVPTLKARLRPIHPHPTGCYRAPCRPMLTDLIWRLMWEVRGKTALELP